MGHEKPVYRGGGGLPKKCGLRQFADLREGACQERGRVVFLRGVDTPMHTMSAANKGQAMVNQWQSSAFVHLYLSCNGHCDWWLFHETFCSIIILS